MICLSGAVQLPSDAEIIMATLKMRRRQQTAVPLPPSTYAQDLASITSHSGAFSTLTQKSALLVAGNHGV